MLKSNKLKEQLKELFYVIDKNRVFNCKSEDDLKYLKDNFEMLKGLPVTASYSETKLGGDMIFTGIGKNILIKYLDGTTGGWVWTDEKEASLGGDSFKMLKHKDGDKGFYWVTDLQFK